MEALLLAIGLFALFILGVAIIGLIVAWPVMLLWNGCLVPAIAGVSDITWLQAWGLIILFSILIKDHTSCSNKE